MYQTQDIPAISALRTQQQCRDITSSPNNQQLAIQMREVQTDDRWGAVALVLFAVVIMWLSLKFLYGM